MPRCRALRWCHPGRPRCACHGRCRGRTSTARGPGHCRCSRGHAEREGVHRELQPRAACDGVVLEAGVLRRSARLQVGDEESAVGAAVHLVRRAAQLDHAPWDGHLDGSLVALVPAETEGELTAHHRGGPVGAPGVVVVQETLEVEPEASQVAEPQSRVTGQASAAASSARTCAISSMRRRCAWVHGWPGPGRVPSRSASLTRSSTTAWMRVPRSAGLIWTTSRASRVARPAAAAAGGTGEDSWRRSREPWAR